MTGEDRRGQERGDSVNSITKMVAEIVRRLLIRQ